MTDQDLEQALQLSRIAGWNQTQEDWRFLLTQDDQNNWAIEDQNRIVGSATSLLMDDAYFWIGMVLVHPEWRRRGLARRLMAAAMNRDEPTAFRLDASKMGLSLYQTLGFSADATLIRFKREGLLRQVEQVLTIPSDMRIEEMQSKHLSMVLEFDRRTCGIARATIIKDFMRRGVGFVLYQSDQVIGYGMKREGDLTHHIGPIVSTHVGAAVHLLNHLAGRSNIPISVDVFHHHEALIELLVELGFREDRQFIRMSHGYDVNRSEIGMFCSFDPAMG
ncbi:MAG: GNAT family N-acetyltransferase [Saprospiraceae bacterium]|nr:GNAT family N-acetyltransferase [Saprospiraceae bacterium]